METIRRANKKHKCDFCNGVIYPKNKYTEIKQKIGKFDSEENQIGIDFVHTRIHLNYSCVGRLQHLKLDEAKEILKKCDKGNHEFIEEYEFDHYVGCHKVGAPTGFFFCKNCGDPK